MKAAENSVIGFYALHKSYLRLTPKLSFHLVIQGFFSLKQRLIEQSAVRDVDNVSSVSRDVQVFERLDFYPTFISIQQKVHGSIIYPGSCRVAIYELGSSRVMRGRIF